VLEYCNVRLNDGASCHNALVFYLKSTSQGRNEGGQGGHNSPGAKSPWGRRKVPTMSQVLSSIQYICFLTTLNSNMGAPNLLLAPGAIKLRYAPATSLGFGALICSSAVTSVTF